jgi:hypothetical protein
VTIAPDGATVRIELEPDPVMLKQIEVVSNRLERRRNAIPYSVQAYDAEDLATTASFDAFDFVRTRLFTAPCRSLSFSTTCVRRRGQVISPEVFVDDSHYFGGLDILYGWMPQDLYAIEVIANGAQVRIYTKNYADRLARGKMRMMPVIIH